MNEKIVGYYLAAAGPLKKETSGFTKSVMKKVEGLAGTLPQPKKMLLKRLPAIAVLAIVVGAIALLSGSAYAAYKLLWQKPEVHISSQTKTTGGRDEVALSFQDCDKRDVGTRYVLKNGASITASDVPKVVEAHCELDAIGAWAKAAFPNDDSFGSQQGVNGQPYDMTMLTTATPTTVKLQDASSITFVGVTKYNQPDTSYPLSSSVRYIVDGHDAKASDIKVGDVVTYITTSTRHMVPVGNCTALHCSYNGAGSATTTLLAVIKLSMPAQYYDPLAWQSLVEDDSCSGNPNDECLTGNIGGIDLYMGGGDSTKLGDNVNVYKEIQGVITSLDGTHTTIKSSSGTLYTIVTPTDVIANYNNNRASAYNNQHIGIGSSIDVRYIESKDVYSKTIPANEIQQMQLMLELISKGDPIKAY